MKNIWKVLGITALAAAVPVRVKKDDVTGKRKYQSLLLSVDVGPGEDGEGTDIGINLGEGVITGAITNLVTAKKEAELYADDDPDAAVLEMEEMQILAGEAQEAQETAVGESAIALEADDDDDPVSEF